MMGQINFKLCNTTLRFMEMNASSASIKRTAFVSTSANISFMAWIAVSASAFTSNSSQYFFSVGLRPGFLFNGIKYWQWKFLQTVWIVVSSSEQSHIVHPAPFLLGNVEPPTKFSKTKDGTESQYLEGGCWERGGWPLPEGCSYYIKNKTKSEIFNDRRSL